MHPVEQDTFEDEPSPDAHAETEAFFMTNEAFRDNELNQETTNGPSLSPDVAEPLTTQTQGLVESSEPVVEVPVAQDVNQMSGALHD